MRPLRYSINVTLDGCCDHRVMIPDEDTHRHAAESIARADALLFGRVTYQMMEAGWRTPDRVDWNAELVRGDLRTAVLRLKQEPGKGLGTGGVMLPQALAELGLIDEYELIVHPRVAGHGPTLFAGLSKLVDLTLVDRVEFKSGVVALRYEPKRETERWRE